MKIQFIESPTGAYNLAYDVGMVADFPKDKAEELIKAGYAVEVKKEKRILKAETTEKRGQQLQSNDGASKRTVRTRRRKKPSKG